MAHGKEARQHLQFLLLTGDHLDDVTASLAFLKTVPGVDARQIYTPVGQTTDEGHNLLYLAVPRWEADVFAFLDAQMKRRARGD